MNQTTVVTSTLTNLLLPISKPRPFTLALPVIEHKEMDFVTRYLHTLRLLLGSRKGRDNPMCFTSLTIQSKQFTSTPLVVPPTQVWI